MSTTPDWDRFARWPRWPARLVLLALLGLLVAAMLVPIHAKLPKPGAHGAAAHATAAPVARPKPARAEPPRRDADLALYDRVIARIRGGERYYDFIVDEQRRSHYPVTPGFAVRLPTLAYAEAWAGETGSLVVAVLLLLAVLAAWWRRLGEEPGWKGYRIAAIGLLLWLSLRALTPFYLVMHELWAGMLLALAFALHRPGRRWLGEFAAAALALSIRELALPFVLLMTAAAGWRRDWKEAAAWAALMAVFAALLMLHFHLVAEHVLPTDRPSASWLGLRGLSGWFSNVILPSNLRYMDYRISAVLVVMAMLGWAGWRSAVGAFGFWLHTGYAVAFMIAGRWENFYWGWIVAPTLMIGLAFAPRALASLLLAGFPDAAWLRRLPLLRAR